MSNKRYSKYNIEWQYIERGERLVQNALEGCYVDCFDLASCLGHGFPIENLRPLLISDDVDLVRLAVMALDERPRQAFNKWPDDFNAIIAKQINRFQDEMLTYYGNQFIGNDDITDTQ